MKKLLTILSLSIILSCSTKKVEYLDTDYDSVLNAASSDDKMIFFDFYTVWCGGCTEYDKHVFTDSTFKEYIISGFYSSKINAELPQNKAIAKKFNISAYPTLIIADKDGNEIDRVVGYKEEYGKNSQLLIDKIESLIRGEETMEKLTAEYYQKPDSLLLLRKILTEKFMHKGDYLNMKLFIDQVSNKSQQKAIKDELLYWLSYTDLKNKTKPDPTASINLINSTDIDQKYVEWTYDNLLNYYTRLNQIDSIDHCFEKLLDFEPKGYYYVRKYARFLFENGRKIELANKLSNQYMSLDGAKADHWTPFLTAHSYAQKDQLNKGVAFFDKWMAEYILNGKRENVIWPYEFYIDFAHHYNVSLEKALEYSYVLEELKPSSDYKLLLAKLLHLNNQHELAIKKLNEVIPMIENANKKKEIDRLIEKYRISAN